MIAFTDLLIVLFSIGAACGLGLWTVNKNWKANKK